MAATTCSSRQMERSSTLFANVLSGNLAKINTALNQVSPGSLSAPTVLHANFTCSNSAFEITLPTGTWALHDTGASHHVFNSLHFFYQSSLKRNLDPTKRLTLAGGSETLEVHSTGTGHLNDTHGGSIHLVDSLYVPLLNNNLLAG